MKKTNTSLPNVPRADWERHRNYPEQVLLLGSHKSFLRTNKGLIDWTSAGGDLNHVASRYHSWIQAMRSHEHYEESKLYPYLTRRWNVSFEQAQKGHEQLHERHERVIQAFTDARVTGAREAAAARKNVGDALLCHAQALEEHLLLEENLVIPLLLELSPAEFRRYSTTSARILLRGFETHPPHSETRP